MHMTSLLLVNLFTSYYWYCLRYNKSNSYWRYRWLLKIISPQLEIIFNSHFNVSNYLYVIILHYNTTSQQHFYTDRECRVIVSKSQQWDQSVFTVRLDGSILLFCSHHQHWHQRLHCIQTQTCNITVTFYSCKNNSNNNKTEIKLK